VLRTLAWSPLGNYVATGSGDRRLRVWNPERAHVKHSTELRGHAGAVERVAWHPAREAELASVAADGSVRVWDVRSKGNVAELKTGRDCFTLCWRPDGTEMLVGTKVGLLSDYGDGQHVC
jgi:THO complex subunit 3